VRPAALLRRAGTASGRRGRRALPGAARRRPDDRGRAPGAARLPGRAARDRPDRRSAAARRAGTRSCLPRDGDAGVPAVLSRRDFIASGVAVITAGMAVPSIFTRALAEAERIGAG